MRLRNHFDVILISFEMSDVMAVASHGVEMSDVMAVASHGVEMGGVMAVASRGDVLLFT